MDKGQHYLATALASCGWVVVDAVVAATLRPDLWPHGAPEAGNDLNRVRLWLPSWPDLRRYVISFDGHRELEAWARCGDRLGDRMFVTLGKRPIVVRAYTPPAPPETPADAPPRRPAERDTDLWAGVETHEPAIAACAVCEFYTAGGKCKASDRSGVPEPRPRELRRCLAFVPEHGTSDDRPGRVRWPELMGREPPGRARRSRPQGRARADDGGAALFTLPDTKPGIR